MLKDSIEEMKEELAKLEDEPEKEESEEEESGDKEPEEEKKEEAEEEKVEESDKEEKPDNAAMARMRREAAASKKRADDLEAQLAEARKPKEEEKEEAPQVIPELEEIVLSHRQTKAEREFQALEARFAENNPEYEAISTEYTRALMQSIKVQNPRWNPQQIAEETTRKILTKAAEYLRSGYDPIEELFHEAKELGFSGKSLKEEKVEKEEEEIRPDMKKLAANRKKSTGMGASNGKSESGMTRAYIMQNGLPSPDEWRALPIAERKRLLAGG